MDPTQGLLQLLGTGNTPPSDPLSRLLASGAEQYFPGAPPPSGPRPGRQDPTLTLLSILLRAQNQRAIRADAQRRENEAERHHQATERQSAATLEETRAAHKATQLHQVETALRETARLDLDVAAKFLADYPAFAVQTLIHSKALAKTGSFRADDPLLKDIAAGRIKRSHLEILDHLIERNPNAPAEWYAEVSKAPLSDVKLYIEDRKTPFFRQVFAKTEEAEAKGRKEKGEAYLKEHPEFSKFGPEAMLLVPPGQSWTDLDPTTQRLLLQRGKVIHEADKAREDERKSTQTLTREKDMERFKMESQGQKYEQQPIGNLLGAGRALLNDQGDPWIGDPRTPLKDVIAAGHRHEVDPKTATEVKTAKQFFTIVPNIRAQVLKMSQSSKAGRMWSDYQALKLEAKAAETQIGDPNAPGWLERMKDWLKLQVAKGTKDPDAIVLFGMESEVVIALRTMGEKGGPRAIRAFEGAMNTLGSGNPVGVDNYFRNLEISQAAGLDQRFTRAYRTHWLLQEKTTGKVGRYTMDPGETPDTAKYNVLTEFSLPPNVILPSKTRAPSNQGPLRPVPDLSQRPNAFEQTRAAVERYNAGSPKRALPTWEEWAATQPLTPDLQRRYVDHINSLTVTPPG